MKVVVLHLYLLPLVLDTNEVILVQHFCHNSHIIMYNFVYLHHVSTYFNRPMCKFNCNKRSLYGNFFRDTVNS